MSELSTGTAAPADLAGAPDFTPPPTRRAWLGLAVILLAAFMELLDVTVVTVATPKSRTRSTPATPRSSGSWRAIN